MAKPTTFPFKAGSARIKEYFKSLKLLDTHGVEHETGLRWVMEQLLSDAGKKYKWTLVNEYPQKRPGRNPLRVDHALVDHFNLPRLYCESKDDADDLEKEYQHKLASGYPDNNILFWQPKEALLVQEGRVVWHQPIDTPQSLVEVLGLLFSYEEPNIEVWEKAVEEFRDKVPEIGEGVLQLIRKGLTTHQFNYLRIE